MDKTDVVVEEEEAGAGATGAGATGATGASGNETFTAEATEPGATIRHGFTMKGLRLLGGVFHSTGILVGIVLISLLWSSPRWGGFSSRQVCLTRVDQQCKSFLSFAFFVLRELSA